MDTTKPTTHTFLLTVSEEAFVCDVLLDF